MNKNLILTADVYTDVLDIIFEGRNKSYGAYDLRKTYNKRITTAFFATVTISLLLLFTVFAKHESKTDSSVMKLIDVKLSAIPKEHTKTIVIPPPPLPKTQPIKVELRQFTQPQIVEDKLVPIPPPTQRELEGVKISDITRNGQKSGDEIVAPPVEGNSTGVDPIKKVVDYDIEFKSVQIEATFPGGKLAWTKFLERNLNSALPSEDGAPAGKYTVNVSFLVDRNGSVSEVVAENDPGFHTAEEAVRVIKKSAIWTPAIQNGHNVTYRVRQSITFMVMND